LIFAHQTFNGCLSNESTVVNRKANQKHTEESGIGTPKSSSFQAKFSKSIIFKTNNSARKWSIPQYKACIL